MDQEEIARRINNIKLSPDPDEGPLIIPTKLSDLGKQRLESCIVGKVLSKKAINREKFRIQMPRIIQAKKSVSIEAIGENLFILDFSSNTDRRNALLGGPWNFFKDLVIQRTRWV